MADELERGLFLLGATAVEDKLQDLVPETIHDFISASKNKNILYKKINVNFFNERYKSMDVNR